MQRNSVTHSPLGPAPILPEIPAALLGRGFSLGESCCLRATLHDLHSSPDTGSVDLKP
jgi:hypothetical protein